MSDLTGILRLHSVDGGELLLRLFAALVVGAIIGIDRERRDKPAGLRTCMLVALAAATYTLLALELPHQGPSENVRTDVTRAIEAVTAGAAFLGAGSIIHGRGSVYGVTTGATIWLTGAMGMACGAGFYLLAAVNIVLGMIVLRLFGWASRLLRPADPPPAPDRHPRGLSADG